MKLASLHTGQHLTLKGVPFKIERIIESGEHYLERISDGAMIVKKKNEIVSSYTSGSLIFDGKESSYEVSTQSELDLSSLALEKQKQALRKYYYVKEVSILLGDIPTKTNLYKVIKKVSIRLEDDQNPSVYSVYRWWKNWVDANKDIRVLINKTSGRKGTRKYRGAVRTEIDEVIDEVYLNNQRNTIQATYDALCCRIHNLNIVRTHSLPIPSRASFYRAVGKLNKYDVMSAREGKYIAESHFRATGKGVEPKYILERVEVDHTPLDLMIVNERTGLVEGRPTLTTLIDRYSRMPLGFEIGFEPPSELSVMRTLRNSILPKSYVHEKYSDIKNEWPAYGIPTVLVCDNGLEFHSNQLKKLCAELNIEILYCPKKKGNYKGCVERFIGTLNRQVSHQSPGTTFSNINMRGDYKSVENAKFTLAQAKELVHEWIIDIYCQSIHRSTHATPHSMWSKGLSLVEPTLPSNLDDLNLALSNEKERVLTHKGIQLDNLFYNNSELGYLRTRNAENYIVKLRTDPENIAHIWVYDEVNGDYIKVECIDFEYADGLTKRQNKQIQTEIKDRGKLGFNVNELLEAKERFRKKILNLSSDKLLKERKKAARDNSIKLHQNIPLDNLGSQGEFDWEITDIPNFKTSKKNQG
jgi:putative transposase